MSFKLKLHFNSQPEFGLARVVCEDSLGRENISIRGKCAGAYSFADSFIWSTGVKNLCYFLLVSKYQYEVLGNRYIQSGVRGSLAAKLAFIIKKELLWSTQMFGADSQGRGQLKKLIKISNASFRLRPEIAVSLNLQQINPSDIQVYLDGKLVSPFALKHLASAIQDLDRSQVEVLSESFQEFARYSKCCS